MVAICNAEDGFYQNSRTLGDWVKNFRLKKMQMKRKLRSGGNLRICAILSTALMSAETELRRKQQERFQKWIELQTKINKNSDFQTCDELRHHSQLSEVDSKEGVDDQEMVLITHRHNDEKSCAESEEIARLWKCELSDLDNFMRSISSSSKKSSENYQANLAQNQSIEVTS